MPIGGRGGPARSGNECLALRPRVAAEPASNDQCCHRSTRIEPAPAVFCAPALAAAEIVGNVQSRVIRGSDPAKFRGNNVFILFSLYWRKLVGVEPTRDTKYRTTGLKPAPSTGQD